MPRADYTARTVELLCGNLGVQEKEVELIRLYAKKEQDPAAWQQFFLSIDLDGERFSFNCMLARLGARFTWKHVPEELAPRLQGIRRLFQVKNMTLMSRALKIMGVIQGAGIPMLIMRGGALRMALLPDVPQKMTDIDFAVPKDRYAECLRVLEENGYSIDGYWSHSVDISVGDEPCVDVHWCMFKGNVHHDEPTEAIVQRGSKITKNGVTFSVPSPEDTFLNLLTNAASNYIMLQNGKGSISWLADCIDLSERYELSYATVVEHAREYGVLQELVIAAALIGHFLPDGFSELRTLAGGRIDRRVYRRVKAGMRCFAVSKDDFLASSAPRHLIHALRLIYYENACSYHLADPTPAAVRSYVSLLQDRLKSYDHIEHVWEIPGLIRKRAKVWAERKRGVQDHAEVQ